MSARPFPPGRIGQAQLLADAAMSKNTYYRRFRHDPEAARLLDIQEDRDNRLHFPANAGTLLRDLNGKQPHGNVGRTPGRPCPTCGASLHPRHTACLSCGEDLAPSIPGDSARPRRSTSQTNYLRAEALRKLRGED